MNIPRKFKNGYIIHSGYYDKLFLIYCSYLSKPHSMYPPVYYSGIYLPLNDIQKLTTLQCFHWFTEKSNVFCTNFKNNIKNLHNICKELKLKFPKLPSDMQITDICYE